MPGIASQITIAVATTTKAITVYAINLAVNLSNPNFPLLILE